MSNERKEKVFAKGFYFKRNEKAPDFVIGNLSLKVEDAGPFVKENAKNGYLNLQILKSRSGGFYVELDTFEPKKQDNDTATTSSRQDNDTDELPF